MNNFEELKPGVHLGFDRVSSMVANRDKRTAYIRTSDTISFLGCRRRWGWGSHLMQNLGPKQYGNPLWLGSGIHYALEDFHGKQVYKTAALAFEAFVYAHYKKHRDRLPDDFVELGKQGKAMMEYYPIWLKGRDPLETYVFNGQPQVEPGIQIEIPMEMLPAYDRIREHYDRVVYALQLDRVSIDEHGQLWVVEYKTAKTIQTSHYAIDPQISKYIWAAELVYDKPVAGVIYWQFRKDLPKGPRLLKNGTFSIAQNQRTTHRLYRQALLDRYEDIEKAPAENIAYLNKLAVQETEHADEYIRRDFVYRNSSNGEAIAQQILQVTSDMLDPKLALYPNPTRMCAVYCPFMSACVSRDDGSDWEQELELGFENRDLDYDSWRPMLPDPETFEGIKALTE